MRIIISSGHGKYIRGASGYLDEVNEARRVVERVAEYLEVADIDVDTFHDDTSTTQSQNLNTIVNYHNAQDRDLDVSVHFNAYQTTSKPMGTECLHYPSNSSMQELSAKIADAIALASGLPDRGPKSRSDLAFLNNTEEPAILIETVFVDSSADAQAYQQHFEAICRTIAETLSGRTIGTPPDQPERPEDLPPRALFQVSGSCSWFGGPEDTGVSESEGLAFLYEVDDAPHLFLPEQPEGTTGLARRLNPNLFYVACRWDYNVTPKSMLANPHLQALVRANDQEYYAWPADWGPHEDTGRVADLSPGLMEALGVGTDDEVEIIYPASL